jgi:hypothetical protein
MNEASRDAASHHENSEKMRQVVEIFKVGTDR